MADSIPKSIFSRGSEDEATHSETDYMGAEAKAYSNMPEDIVDGEVKTDEEMGTVVDWKDKDADQAVSQIKRAEDEKSAADAAKILEQNGGRAAPQQK